MIFVPLTFVEGRLHLGKTQKIFDLFGFSLGLHYLCKVVIIYFFRIVKHIKRYTTARVKMMTGSCQDRDTGVSFV